MADIAKAGGLAAVAAMSDQDLAKRGPSFAMIGAAVRSAVRGVDSAGARVGGMVGRFLAKPRAYAAADKIRSSGPEMQSAKRLLQQAQDKAGAAKSPASTNLQRAFDQRRAEAFAALGRGMQRAAGEAAERAKNSILNEGAARGAVVGRRVARVSRVLGSLGLIGGAGYAVGRVSGKDGRAGRDGDGDGILNEGKKK
jgi:hypothetical protein